MKYLALGCSHGKIPKIKTKDFDSILYLGDSAGYQKARTLVNKWLKEVYNHGSSITFEQFVGRRIYSNLQKKEIENARKVIEYINSLNKKVYTLPGNWDYYKDRFHKYKKNYYKKVIIKNLSNVKDLHLKYTENKDNVIIGYGISTNSEIKTPFQYNYYFKRLKRLFIKAKKKKKPVIFITHNQPYNTRFSRIRDKSSPVNGMEVGSNVAKDIIKKFKPLLCIGAHMHEHFGKIKVGKTTCISAGYGMKGDKVLIDAGEKINSIKFIRK